MNKISPLPKSDDYIFEGGEHYTSIPIPLPLCDHRDYMKGTYIDNNGGTASCTKCSWGFRVPGYMRILDGKVFDLRRK